MQLIKKLAPSWFRPDECDAEFYIQPMNGLQALEVMGEVTGDEDQTRLTGKGLKAALRYGLIDWRGITDDGGQEVKFTRALVNDLDPTTLTIIAAEIVNRTRLTEQEEKNSPSQ